MTTTATPRWVLSLVLFGAVAVACRAAATAQERDQTAAAAPPTAALPADATLAVEPLELELGLGKRSQLIARLTDREGHPIEGHTIVFYSRDRRKVSVTPAGLVAAHGAGLATIVALVPGISRTGASAALASAALDEEAVDQVATDDLSGDGSALRAEIRVTVPAPPVAGVAIVDLPPKFYAGTLVRLATRVVDQGGTRRNDVPVGWTSSAPATAGIDALGFLRLNTPGTTTLTASAEGHEARATIVVENNPVAALELIAERTEVRTGDVVFVRATARDREHRPVPDVPVLYSVTGQLDPAILAPGAAATIEADGAFVAERSGVFTVVAVSGSHSAQLHLRVRPRNVRREVKFVGQGPVRDRHTSDLWVWEGRDGHDYAITGTWGAEGHAYIWEVTNPAHITLIDTVKVDARTVNDVKISEDGKLAVISREGAANRRNGLVIIDVSEPQVGVRVLARYDDQLTGGVHNVFVDDHHVYALSNGRRFDVINIEDPAKPHRVGRFELDTPGHSIHDVWVADGIAYSSNWEDGVVAIDVGGGGAGGAPNRPKKLGQYAYPSGWNHAAFPYRSKSTGKFYVFAGDEAFPNGLSGTRPGEAPPRADGWIHVVEWNDWSAPREVARYRVPEAGTHNLWIEDDVMYVAYYNGGLRVVDVSGELRGDLYRQGREIAAFLSNDPQGFIPNSPFVWGPQPYKGHIFFSDWNSGLWAVKLVDPEDRGAVIGEPQ